MLPKYDFNKIKFATDKATFEKAVGLYESRKVTQFKEGIASYSAVVQGSTPYRMSVEARRYDYDHCTCYLGENGTLCKHMVALAIYTAMDGKPLKDEDAQPISGPVCSGQVGALQKEELVTIKKAITTALRYIKPYTGPSRIWFAYQGSLQEGCNRLSAIVSDLPVGVETATLLIDTLLRLDKRLSTGGVDDSDGTVGGFVEGVVGMLEEYARLNSICIKAFAKLARQQTCFGWEAPLMRILDGEMV